MREVLEMTHDQELSIITQLLLNILRIVSEGSFNERIELETAAWIMAKECEIFGIG